jgi:two-component system KDP operon response regulator KdpE
MAHYSPHTLLVIPDLEWALSLYRHLGQNGFAPLTIAPTGESALDLFYHIAPHLVLLDLHLADSNAVELCVRILHVQPSAKIVLVTDANAGPPLTALQAGISGCIDRDFPLAAWPGLLTYILSGGMAFSRSVVQTVLAEVWATQKQPSHITIGPLRIDLAQRLVVYAERHIQLTPREFSLLTCLARNHDRVVTFDQLLSEAWNYDANNGTPAQVRLYVARLRRKLIDGSQTPDFILTERGIGYRLLSEVLWQANLRSENLASPAPKASLAKASIWLPPPPQDNDLSAPHPLSNSNYSGNLLLGRVYESSFAVMPTLPGRSHGTG